MEWERIPTGFSPIGEGPPPPYHPTPRNNPTRNPDHIGRDRRLESPGTVDKAKSRVRGSRKGGAKIPRSGYHLCSSVYFCAKLPVQFPCVQPSGRAYWAPQGRSCSRPRRRASRRRNCASSNSPQRPQGPTSCIRRLFGGGSMGKRLTQAQIAALHGVSQPTNVARGE